MIDDLIAHLKANTSSFVTVTHAQDQRPVDDVVDQLPFLGIFPAGDAASEDGTDYLESKMLTSTVLVHIVCQVEELESLKAELRTAAIGWSAGGYYTDLAFVGGEILSLKGGVMWWEERYANETVLREAY